MSSHRCCSTRCGKREKTKNAPTTFPTMRDSLSRDSFKQDGVNSSSASVKEQPALLSQLPSVSSQKMRGVTQTASQLSYRSQTGSRFQSNPFQRTATKFPTWEELIRAEKDETMKRAYEAAMDYSFVNTSVFTTTWAIVPICPDCCCSPEDTCLCQPGGAPPPTSRGQHGVNMPVQYSSVNPITNQAPTPQPQFSHPTYPDNTGHFQQNSGWVAAPAQQAPPAQPYQVEQYDNQQYQLGPAPMAHYPTGNTNVPPTPEPLVQFPPSHAPSMAGYNLFPRQPALPSRTNREPSSPLVHLFQEEQNAKPLHESSTQSGCNSGATGASRVIGGYPNQDPSGAGKGFKPAQPAYYDAAGIPVY